MASDHLRAMHPRRAGLADALARAFPVPADDREEQEERHELRRLDLKDHLRR